MLQRLFSDKIEGMPWLPSNDKIQLSIRYIDLLDCNAAFQRIFYPAGNDSAKRRRTNSFAWSPVVHELRKMGYAKMSVIAGFYKSANLEACLEFRSFGSCTV